MTRASAFFAVLSLAFLSANGAIANTLSDPTQPFSGGWRRDAEPVPRGPVLQSTRVSSWQRVAVISGRTVAVGDLVDGAIVADIRPYEVLLKKDGRETTLRMLPRLDKKQR